MDTAARKRLLMVYSTQSGRTRRLVEAAWAGAAECADEVDSRLCLALQAGVPELLGCDGLIIATPENFGSMSGAVKDFLDRTYYPCEGRRLGLPYALLVSAGNDGSGTVRQVERIATGFGWKAVCAPLVVIGDPDAESLQRCHGIGQLLAAGLACGVY